MAASGLATASSTAVGDAFIRGSHVATADRPLIRDAVSATLLTTQEHRSLTLSVLRSLHGTRVAGTEDEAAARRNVHTWLSRHSAAAPHVLLRTHLTGEALRRAVEGGVRQYVMLAAGLETFAVNRPEWARDVTVVELDLPQTQRFKTARIAAAGHTSVARNVEADLEDPAWARALLNEPAVRPDEPAFVSLCGVSYYLSATGLATVLRSLGRIFRGGVQVVVDYWDSARLDPAAMDRPTRSMVASVARNGEPFRTAFTPDTWAGFVRKAGLVVRSDRSAPDYLATLLDDHGLVAWPVGRLSELTS